MPNDNPVQCKQTQMQQQDLLSKLSMLKGTSNHYSTNVWELEKYTNYDSPKGGQ